MIIIDSSKAILNLWVQCLKVLYQKMPQTSKELSWLKKYSLIMWYLSKLADTYVGVSKIIELEQISSYETCGFQVDIQTDLNAQRIIVITVSEEVLSLLAYFSTATKMFTKLETFYSQKYVVSLQVVLQKFYLFTYDNSESTIMTSWRN